MSPGSLSLGTCRFHWCLKPLPLPPPYPSLLSTSADTRSGNQGVGFKYLSREGFGWTNASVSIGVQFLTTGQRRAVSNLTSPWEYFDLPVPDEPAIRSREDRARYEADAEAARERPRRSSGVFTKSYEQTVADLKSMRV